MVHGEVMFVFGVGVSPGLGTGIEVWAREQHGGSVMMRAVFEARLPSSLLPAAASVDTLSHVGSRPQRWFPRALWLPCLVCFVLYILQTTPRKRRITNHAACRVCVADKPLENVH